MSEMMVATRSPARASRAARSDRPTMPLYAGGGWLRRHRRLCLAALVITAIFYGFAFAVYSQFLLLQTLVPLLVLAAVVIWLLPETGRAPAGLLGKLLVGFLFILLCWPDYLAIALPGLPWITGLRLIGVPMTLILLICVSVSSAFRARMAEVLSVTPSIWKLLLVFTATALVSILFSKDKALSINKFVVAQMSWTAVFFASCYVFSLRGRAARMPYYLWAISLFVCFIGVWEASQSRVPWAGHIPWFLKVEDEAVQRILAGGTRAATGVYRVQSKFTTSLGLGEFLGMAAPFIIHLMMSTRRVLLRVATGATLPIVFYVIVQSNSRLAAIGFFMSVLLYVLVWGALRWRDRKDSLFGPAIVIGYPALFCGFIAATFLVGRLRGMVWGSGPEQASTDSRQAMYTMGYPKVLANPIGHGIGMGSETLGFVNQAGRQTIDTYYLAVALEYGVVGFVAYYGILLIAIWQAGKYALKSRDPEVLLLMPMCIALINFVISKSVFSQQENHPLVFLFIGMMMALIWRHQQDDVTRRTITK